MNIVSCDQFLLRFGFIICDGSLGKEQVTAIERELENRVQISVVC